MAKPQIKNIAPFDAKLDHVIEFIWTGSMAYKNRLQIFDNDSLASVYDQTVTTFDLKHTIPAGTLQNGKKYLAQVRTFDKDEVESPTSDKSRFLTLETPHFRFTNVEDGQNVDASSLTATVSYTQANGEKVDSYRFYLYDEAKRQVFVSEPMTYQPYMSYIYKGLENTKTYYIRCLGSTANGMPLDTGYVKFTAYYLNPGDYKLIYAENYPYKGYNTYRTNIKIIECDDYQEDRYAFDDGYIDLLDDEITYSSNFKIDDDFTLMIRGKFMYQEAQIFSATNGDGAFEICSYIYDDKTLRYRITAHSDGYEYILYSDAVPAFTQDDIITLWVQRKDNYYAIAVFVKKSNGVEGGMWFGIPDPSNYGAADYDIWLNSDEPKLGHVNVGEVLRYVENGEPGDAPQYAVWIGGQ